VPILGSVGFTCENRSQRLHRSSASRSRRPCRSSPSVPHSVAPPCRRPPRRRPPVTPRSWCRAAVTRPLPRAASCLLTASRLGGRQLTTPRAKEPWATRFRMLDERRGGPWLILALAE